jgi:hypothetical protein
MAGAPTVRAVANEAVTIAVPSEALPGYYWVRASGQGLHQTARTIRVVE